MLDAFERYVGDATGFAKMVRTATPGRVYSVSILVMASLV
jgi:hypothetical protein